jgi:hypothetical protein
MLLSKIETQHSDLSGLVGCCSERARVSRDEAVCWLGVGELVSDIFGFEFGGKAVRTNLY